MKDARRARKKVDWLRASAPLPVRGVDVARGGAKWFSASPALWRLWRVVLGIPG